MVKAQFLVPLFLLVFLTAIAAVPANATTLLSGCVGGGTIYWASWPMNTTINVSGTYQLTSDVNHAFYPNGPWGQWNYGVYTSVGTCVFINASNTVFDCQNYKINTNNNGICCDSGITIGTNASNLVIKNCDMEGWYDSFSPYQPLGPGNPPFSSYCNNCTFENITCSGYGRYGLELIEALGTNLTFIDTKGCGVTNTATTTTTTTIPTIPPCQVCDISNLPIGSMGLGAIPGAFVCGMLNILFCVPILFALVILGMVGIWYWRKLRG